MNQIMHTASVLLMTITTSNALASMDTVVVSYNKLLSSITYADGPDVHGKAKDVGSVAKATRNNFARLVHINLGTYGNEIQGNCTLVNDEKSVSTTITNLFSSLENSADDDYLAKKGTAELKKKIAAEITALNKGSIICDFSTWDGGDTGGNALTVYNSSTKKVTLFNMYLIN